MFLVDIAVLVVLVEYIDLLVPVVVVVVEVVASIQYVVVPQMVYRTMVEGVMDSYIH